MNMTELLNAATDKFFPKEGKWYSSCFKRPNELLKTNLPCHLRDNKWLAKMFWEDQKLYLINMDNIMKYVESSPYFEEKRHEYELEIVKWQINWMKSGGENWLVPEGFGDEFIEFNPNVDIGFREGVIKTLTSIGMDKEVVEEGLEVFGYIWKEKYMESAFFNTYNNPLDLSLISELNEASFVMDDEFKDKWIMKRKYDYYQKHKSIVDKYGKVEPCMKLNEEDIKTLNIYLDIKHDERMKELKSIKEKSKKRQLKFHEIVNFD